MIRALLLFFSAATVGLSARICQGDGEHAEIDVRQLQIQYSGVSARGTLDALAKLGLDVRTVQTATQETQKLNQYLQALAAGFNSCAISKAQYFEATQLILPRAKQDAALMEAVRNEMAAGRKVTEGRLNALIQSYLGNLKELAATTGLKADAARIEAEIQAGFGQVNQKLDAVLERLPKPDEVNTEIDRKLNAKKDEAKTAYAQGYKLIGKYQFAEAVPYFRRAVAVVKLPEFFFGMAIALWRLPDLAGAEAAAHDGLALLLQEPDEALDADLTGLLGLILQGRGDLAGAQRQTERALQIDEKVYGPDHPNVATEASNLGLILKERGDLAGAQRHAERALQIDEKVYGSDHPKVAIRAGNLGLILQDRGDLAGAQRQTERALQIDEKVYGPDHPNVAIRASNLGLILYERGDLAGAQRQTERALQIDEKVYGPDLPNVATFAGNLGSILQARGDLAGAQRQTERALQIDEKVYGPDHPNVAIRASNLGFILYERGDLAGAQRQTERALQIDEKVYGPDHPNVAQIANNLGSILQARGDLAGAQRQIERAL